MRDRFHCIAPVVSSNEFTWTGNVGVADASESSNFTGRRFYNDSCDEGFIVRSMRTYSEASFIYTNTKYSNDGEAIADIYTSQCGKYQIHILND